MAPTEKSDHAATKKIVVVGGGFAGLNFIKSMTNAPGFEIILLDRDNYHYFPPLLYQVATAFIEPSNISYPYRKFLQQKQNVRFCLGKLICVNPNENSIDTTAGILKYDYLVIAAGTESNFFGMENVKQHALPLKTINDATLLRNHMLLTLEKAVRASDEHERSRLLNVVIAGGGPTGVEIAGILAEMGRHIAPKEYPEIKNIRIPIYLVEAGPSLLGPMSKKAQQEAERVLKKLGVKVILNTPVKDYLNGDVILGNGDAIPTGSLIWTSGVIAASIDGLPPETFTRGKRILTDGRCRVKTTQNIFAIGDIALCEGDPKYPGGHPQLAQAAIQQGNFLASWFKWPAKRDKTFRYRDKGTMAIISKFNAVVDLPRMFLRGFVAWMIWLFVHLIPIAGFRNKTFLFFNWMWSFITNDPTLRLILRPGTTKEAVKTGTIHK